MRKPSPLALPLAALALAFLSAACWAPYYDSRVSSSVFLARKLGDPRLSIGPISGENGFKAMGDFEFLPSRPSANPWNSLDGFLVQKDDDYARIAFIELYNGSYRFAPANRSMSNFLGEGALMRSEAANGANPQLIAIVDHQSVYQFGFDPSTHSFTQLTMPNTDTTSVRVFGAGAYLSIPATDTDTYAVLFSDGTRNLVSASDIGAALPGSLMNQMGTTLDAGGWSLAGGGGAFLDAANSRFYYSEPGGPTLLWDPMTWLTSPPVELAIPERVTVRLSDGTLVAQGDNYLSAYAATGGKLFTIAAGSIRLQHEVYCPGPSPVAGNYLIFSQVLVEKSGDSSQTKYYIKVWSYPLSKFGNLED